MSETTQERPASRIKEFSQFNMFTKMNESEPRSSKLAWAVLETPDKIYPRLTVFTNTKSDPVANNIISAGMDAETVFSFLNAFEKIASGENNKKGRVVCMTTSRDNSAGNGSAVGEKIHACDIVFGKDENGIVWISLIAKDRPRIKFEYHISDFHEIFNGDGSPYTDAQASEAQALATIVPMRGIYVNVLGNFKPARSPNDSRPAYGQQKQTDEPTYQAKKPELTFDDDVF